ncbi:glycosyl hydrolase 115 family protein [Pseudobutyrivibrio xylanivorans]|uniref:Alpha-glucuronidase n=1 Tax=Pseudobutyrivibrio xylanivorans TaxID=185007 RepID=A0A5P6VW59_PSEXY|nr:glycosyl hydrolase 115 family protein [Pseudobutyrivibrio xylanivorans]QFJ55991.1 alpha-glucuronidase [Pseudobutyrivibrio xylanivorans]
MFELFKDGSLATIVLDDNGVHGMKKMTEIFAEDIKRVTGRKPEIVEELPGDSKYVIYVGLAESEAVNNQFVNAIDVSEIKGKREVYGIFMFRNPADATQKILAIIGSDKRGATYGMFNLSEKMGVSPWYYWADATVKRRSEVVFDKDICVVSKEPSVRYRGFFINDEQPCLGEWAKENYGSISPCPILYEKIFELLLRLKGNYIWPAMWRSDFTLDYFANAELANEMGVIVGASHHEPCCRSGQEFQRLRHDNPQYGEDWSFLSNAEGITEFWKDGLIRNKDFENLITIGMRGENDSYLMPADATLEDNINVLKSAITKQKELIAKYAPSEHPQLLALYKEVEDYYYGDETTKGLKDWDALDNDIMMLCDDNFANVRTLPDDDLRKKSGGFGMYYHFDYFGEPVSYLWINSSPLSKVWEQMTMAYDYGVRSAWIVNVGDIKNQELPLSYFLDLAYDFDKWGTSAINQTTVYTENWLKNLGFDKEVAVQGAKLINQYVGLNAKRRPEALRPDTYHAVHENEAFEMLDRICDMNFDADTLFDKVKATELEECFYQLIYYPVKSVGAINNMQISASINANYIRQGKKIANEYADVIRSNINYERKLVDEYHTRNNGKWNHMQSVYHIGFTNWNDEQCQYPVCQYYNPVRDSRLMVSIADREDFTGAHRWTRHVLQLPLCFQSRPEAGIEIGNGGEKELHYHIDWDGDWLEIKSEYDDNPIKKNEAAVIDNSIVYYVKVLRDKWDNSSSTMIRIYGDDCEVVADESENGGSITMVEIQVNVTDLDLSETNEQCFLEADGCISIEAGHFSKAIPSAVAEYKEIKDYGKTESGMKAYPQNIRFDKEEDAPALIYNVFSEEDAEFTCHIYAAASNPVVYRGKLELGVAVNNNPRNIVNTIPEKGFDPWKSESWRKGVLDQIHIGSCKLRLKKGLNEIKLTAIDPAVVIEKLVLWKDGTEIRKSYLGPKESVLYKGKN